MRRRKVTRTLRGVGARLFGAVLVPLATASLLMADNVNDLQQQQAAASDFESGVDHLVSMVELHSAVLVERSLCGTSEEVDLSSVLPQLIGQARRTTDTLLASIAADAQPFKPADITRVRQLDDNDGVTCQKLAGYHDDLAQEIRDQLEFDASRLSHESLVLGDNDVEAMIDVMLEAVELATTTQTIDLELADYFAAPEFDQTVLRSKIAITSQEMDEAKILIEASADSDVRSRWFEAKEKLRPQQELITAALEGNLVPPTVSGESIGVGIGMASGLPLLASLDVQERTDELTAEAEADLRTGLILAAIALLVSVGAALAFARSILRPTLQLTRHARAVGDGDLDIEPMRLEGPPEVVDASRAVNDMVSNLQLVRHKSEALAALDLEHPVLKQPLSGALGDSIRQSMVVLSDSVQARHELQSRLSHEASHDLLTGIPNRSAAISFLNEALADADRNSRSVAAVFLDLDGFKQINDTYGHAVGDATLREVASRIQRTVRSGDLSARLGGDEFLLVATRVAGVREAIAVASRAVEAITRTVVVEGIELDLGACAGVAMWPSPIASDGETDPFALLRQADLAVYEAKAQGTNIVTVYDTELNDRLTARHDTEEALRSALASDDQFHLNYQPIVDAATGATVGVEALLRWTRPDIGPVRPDSFIPVAEDSNLILDIDRWVMAAAFAEAASWADNPAMADLAVAVNISGRHLIGQNLAADVAVALQASGIDPGRVVIEITETVLVDDMQEAASCLHQVRGLGVKVAVDDFGTGFTSLMHLRMLPLDKIKIDRSLIQGLCGSSDSSELVRMVVEVARHLGAVTVAEGVETDEQRELLRGFGCQLLQGYRFSRPLSTDALVDYVVAAHAHATGALLVPVVN